MTVAPGGRRRRPQRREHRDLQRRLAARSPSRPATPSRSFIVTVSCVRAETSPDLREQVRRAAAASTLSTARERPLVAHRHVDHRQPLGRRVDPAHLHAVHVEQREAGRRRRPASAPGCSGTAATGSRATSTTASPCGHSRVTRASRTPGHVEHLVAQRAPCRAAAAACRRARRRRPAPGRPRRPSRRPRPATSRRVEREHRGDEQQPPERRRPRPSSRGQQDQLAPREVAPGAGALGEPRAPSWWTPRAARPGRRTGARAARRCRSSPAGRTASGSLACGTVGVGAVTRLAAAATRAGRDAASGLDGGRGAAGRAGGAVGRRPAGRVARAGGRDGLMRPVVRRRRARRAPPAPAASRRPPRP